MSDSKEILTLAIEIGKTLLEDMDFYAWYCDVTCYGNV